MHLLVSFSDHGFGHIAQCAPVVNALRREAGLGNALRLTVYSRAPEDFLRSRLEGPFTRLERDTGVGMVMDDAMVVNRRASLAAYQAFHRDWPARVAAEAEALRGLAPAPHGPPDLVLCDVPYLPLAAAREAGIPAVALCSFNWHDMFVHYCGDLEPEPAPPGAPAPAPAPEPNPGDPTPAPTPAPTPGADPSAATPSVATIARQIRQAYEAAALFIQPEPSVPGPPWLPLRSVGPIGQVGTPRRAELDRRHPGLAGRRLVLVTLGGIQMTLPLQRWPRLPGVTWIVKTEAEAARHPDALAQAALLDPALPFEDLLASCDAVITKPGYGTYVEAAALGLPVLYTSRGDWPEEPHLATFLQRATRAQEIPLSTLTHPTAPPTAPTLADALHSLWSQPLRPPIPPTGAPQAASLLLSTTKATRGGRSSIIR
jgi:hypothetical protein